MPELKQESIFINVADQKLHLKRIFTDESGQPVFMVHGSIENGRIFYSESGKGLAPYLAKAGYDVFIADLRGKGKSTPKINKDSTFGLTEVIREDMPAFINKIKEIKGNAPQHWFSHSFGGVLMLACLALNPEIVRLSSMVTFGNKRYLQTQSFKRFMMLNLGWYFLGSMILMVKKFLPAKKMNLGADDETKKTFRETNQWLERKEWRDWYDGFDYAAKLRELSLPPVLSLTGANDPVLGRKEDCQRLLDEIESKNHEVVVIGKENGNLHDYNHNDLVTHRDAPEDHYKIVLEWMEGSRQTVVGNRQSS